MLSLGLEPTAITVAVQKEKNIMDQSAQLSWTARVCNEQCGHLHPGLLLM